MTAPRKGRGAAGKDRGVDGLSIALRLLTRRARSTAEIRERLAREGVSEEAIAEVLARLREWGYLDDKAFAQAWVSDRTRLRPTGTKRLEAELREKGVSPEIIHQVLQERTETAEIQMAADLAAKRRTARQRLGADGDTPQVVDQAEERRLLGYLLRRGFSITAARRALRQARLEEAYEEPEP
jgi:regulatory protein